MPEITTSLESLKGKERLGDAPRAVLFVMHTGSIDVKCVVSRRASEPDYSAEAAGRPTTGAFASPPSHL